MQGIYTFLQIHIYSKIFLIFDLFIGGNANHFS